MIIDDLQSAIQSVRTIRPTPDGYYIVFWHPDQVRSQRHWEARDRYYWNHWVERYNRRAERLGLPVMGTNYDVEVGSFFGAKA